MGGTRGGRLSHGHSLGSYGNGNGNGLSLGLSLGHGPSAHGFGLGHGLGHYLAHGLGAGPRIAAGAAETLCDLLWPGRLNWS